MAVGCVNSKRPSYLGALACGVNRSVYHITTITPPVR